MFANWLGWSDVAPSRRAPFDLALAEQLTHPLVTGWDRGRKVDELEGAIDRALLSEYGVWAAGWRWSSSEPGGGGPVSSWCCARDSLLCEGDEDAAASTARVVAALAEWHAFLVDVEAIFDDLPRGASSLATDIELAAGRLLPLVVERTQTQDAWYATLSKVLVWYAESRGHDASLVAQIIGEVIRGRFHSWTEPDEGASHAAWAELAARLSGELPGLPDATLAWWAIRPTAFKPHPETSRHRRLERDGHRRFIAGAERARDAERADAMEVALDACRASASAREPLTFELLARWQAIVLGTREPPAFRAGQAFAKGGRDRYGLEAATPERFARCVLEANDATTPVAVRAARVYLDVCFFHPFDDGNARAARLALDHVLSRAGLGLHTVEPLFVVSRSPLDARGAWYLAYLVGYLSGRTG